MTFKQARRIVLSGIILIMVIFVLVKCVPDVSADPVGPITIETHLQNINDNMAMIKYIGGGFGGLLSVIGGLLVYIFLDLKKRVIKVEEQADHIEETFMSIATHDRICKDGG